MARATLADGHTIRFPDGLTPDQVKNIISKASANGAASANPQMQKADLGVPMPAPTPDTSLGHNAKLFGQSALQGAVGNTLGLPGDINNLTSMAAGGITSGLTSAVNNVAIPAANYATGAEIPSIGTSGPSYEESRQMLNDDMAKSLTSWGIDPSMASWIANAHVPGGQDIGSAASDVAQQFGYEPAKPETAAQRLGSTITEFGAGALTGGGLLASGAKTALKAGVLAKDLPALARPYAQNAQRTLIGDTAGAVGAGVANNALDEYAPDWLS